MQVNTEAIAMRSPEATVATTATPATTATTEQTPSLTWAELVAENEHLPGLLRASLESAMSALNGWESCANARTELCADAALSALARFLIPLNRGSSITRQRLSEHAQPDMQRREAEQAKAKEERIKRNRAAGAKKAKATRAANRLALGQVDDISVAEAEAENED